MNYLEVPTKDTRYTYPTGRIRGLEKYLLKPGDFARIKEGKDLSDSFQNLSRFYPYSESMKVCDSPEDFERGFEEEWKRVYLELRSFAPEPELVDLFWLEQDFHNIKVGLKIKVRQKVLQDTRDVKHLSLSGTLNPSLLMDALTREDLSSLPSFFKEVISHAMQMIEKGAVSREIDFFLDRMYFSKFSSGLSEYGDDFLEELAKKLIDNFNVKSFLRIKLWKREDEKKIFSQVILDGGTFEKEKIVALAGEPLDSSISFFGGIYRPILQKALEEWRVNKALFTLDKALGKVILDFTSRGFYMTFGREPLVNYILIRKLEITTLRSILRAKKANLTLEEMEKIGL